MDFLNKQEYPGGPRFIIKIISPKKTKTETPRFEWRGLFIDFARNIWKYPPYERFVFQVGIPGLLLTLCYCPDGVPYGRGPTRTRIRESQ